jgi:hypothetical protein
LLPGLSFVEKVKEGNRKWRSVSAAEKDQLKARAKAEDDEQGERADTDFVIFSEAGAAVVAVAQPRRMNCAGLSAKRRAVGNTVRTWLSHPFWVGGARLMRFNTGLAEEKIVNDALSVVQAECFETFSFDINVVENAGARLPKPFTCCKHARGGLCCKSDLTERRARADRHGESTDRPEYSVAH